MYIHPLKIGNVTLKNNLVLAPMAGITDGPFRVLCLKGGAGLVCAEMVSAHALHYGNEKSGKMLQVAQSEHPVSMQIFGSDEVTIAEAARYAELAGADIIDINAGCPVKKINKAGAGCVLMKDPIKLGKLVLAAVKSVKIPVTLKTRISLNRENLLGGELVKVAQDNGAKAIALHARAAVDVHTGEPNILAISKACQVATIPVIGNGGIKNYEDVKKFIDAGCSAVMIGRGAVGNPFVFQEILEQSKKNTFTTPDAKKRLEFYLALIEENVKFYGDRIGINRSRKTAGYWINNFPNATDMRSRYVRLEQIEEIRTLFAEFIRNLKK